MILIEENLPHDTFLKWEECNSEPKKYEKDDHVRLQKFLWRKDTQG